MFIMHILKASLVLFLYTRVFLAFWIHVAPHCCRCRFVAVFDACGFLPPIYAVSWLFSRLLLFIVVTLLDWNLSGYFFSLHAWRFLLYFFWVLLPFVTCNYFSSLAFASKLFWLLICLLLLSFSLCVTYDRCYMFCNISGQLAGVNRSHF